MTAEPPRLMSGADVATYCGITLATLAAWISTGRLPGPLPGTRRWDRKALDLALDKASGIKAPSLAPDGSEALEQWVQEDAAEQAAVARGGYRN